jgi:superfamily II DNA/RNA helicase
MIELFKSLNMNLSLADALQKEGITAPTDVQRKTIPEALKNKDLVIQSETGTGKTLAYILPLFAKVDTSKREMQAIILAPTHELSVQILKQLERLSQNSEIKASSALIIGNVNIERQMDKLKEKPHIIVGSPGRILELIKKRKITAHTVKTIIIDEADRLTDKNNIDIVKSIIKSTLKERQLLMVSASITKEAEICAKEIMKEPEFIRETRSAAVPTHIEHIYFLAEKRDKIEVLRKAVNILKPQKAMVFVGEREETDIFVAKLKYHGLNVEGIQGHNKKLERKRALDEFRSGKIQLLIASDIAARGLDIEGVTHIFNLSIPETSENYLHRVGRTGRKGNAGLAVSIATKQELQFIRMYEKELKIKIAPKGMYKGNITDVKLR